MPAFVKEKRFHNWLTEAGWHQGTEVAGSDETGFGPSQRVGPYGSNILKRMSLNEAGLGLCGLSFGSVVPVPNYRFRDAGPMLKARL